MENIITLTTKDKLRQYLEGLNEYQLELVLSFIETLFDLTPDD